MPAGGKRDGAGRPAMFRKRKAFPVYIESVDLETVMVFASFYKDHLDDRTFSISSLATSLVQNWVRGMMGELNREYLDWLAENKEWVLEKYPLEYNKRMGIKDPQK